MNVLLRSLFLLGLVVGHRYVRAAVTTHPPATTTTTPRPLTPQERVDELEQLSEQLSRQMMLQQLYVEERTRTEGDSGIKQVLRLHINLTECLPESLQWFAYQSLKTVHLYFYPF